MVFRVVSIGPPSQHLPVPSPAEPSSRGTLLSVIHNNTLKTSLYPLLPTVCEVGRAGLSPTEGHRQCDKCSRSIISFITELPFV